MKAAVKYFSPEYGIDRSSGITMPTYKPVQIDDVTAFLTTLGPNRVIGVSISGETVLVWYWDGSEPVEIGGGM